MATLKQGSKAPDFKAKDQNGNTLSLSDFNGKKLVLYFYPKDDTPTCTNEACSLRDGYAELKKQGYEIIGVSADSEKSHKKFIAKYNLPFQIIADPEKKVINLYGVWGKKKLFGRTYEGIIRKTFVISENGVIEKIIEKVNSKNHALQILKN
jgi:peroxiredoxin Q/BCP